MGIARLKTLYDLRRLCAHLRVTCPACSRSGVFAAEATIEYFHRRNWNPAWSEAGRHFRCDACGHRGATLSIAPAGTPPAPPPLHTKYTVREAVRRSRG